MNSISVALTLVTVFCPECSIPFGVLEHMAANPDRLHCPHGHRFVTLAQTQPVTEQPVSDPWLIQTMREIGAERAVAAPLAPVPAPAPVATVEAPVAPAEPTPEWLSDGARVTVVRQPNGRFPNLIGRTAVVRAIAPDGIRLEVLNSSGQVTGKFNIEDPAVLAPEPEPDYTQPTTIPVLIQVADKKGKQSLSRAIPVNPRNPDLDRLRKGVLETLRKSVIAVHTQAIIKAVGAYSNAQDTQRVYALLAAMKKSGVVSQPSKGTYRLASDQHAL